MAESLAIVAVGLAVSIVAVATERFLEKPQQLRERDPALYGELRRFYGLDPEMLLPAAPESA